MILIVNACCEKLHYLEFVKPIENILRSNKISFFTKHYREIKRNDLIKADKAIICGTSLKDNKFVDDIKYFDWIKHFDKPVLGICAGMQIIGIVQGGTLKRKTEIGFYHEIITGEFLGLKGEQEVYHLHNNYVIFPNEFEIFSKSKIPQAVKKQNLYGVLFHPEVRQKKIIVNFCNLVY